MRPGETGLTGNVYCGLHECAEMAFVLHVVRPEDVFVDVGANVGSYTVLACAARGAKGYCFEPVPETYERLLDNLRLNGLAARVSAFNIGIADAEGELAFTSGEDTANHAVADQEACAKAVRVRVRALDAVLEDERPFLMKVDVEGFETRVVEGARAVLSNPSVAAVIMELNGSGSRYGFSEDAILDTMRNYGFSTYSYDPFSRTLASLPGKSPGSGNTLFIRDEEAVKERIAKAPRVTIGRVQL